MRHYVQVEDSLIGGCRYEEIRCLYVKRLAYIWVEDWTGDIRTKIENKIDDFIGGDIQHAVEMVSALWKVVNEDGDIESPPSFPVTVGPFWVRILHMSAHST